jgi:hypothetical protein
VTASTGSLYTLSTLLATFQTDTRIVAVTWLSLLPHLNSAHTHKRGGTVNMTWRDDAFDAYEQGRKKAIGQASTEKREAAAPE